MIASLFFLLPTLLVPSILSALVREHDVYRMHVWVVERLCQCPVGSVVRSRKTDHIEHVFLL